MLSVVRPDTAALLPESVAFLLDQGARYLVISLDHAAPWDERDMEVLRVAYERLGEMYIDLTRAGRKFYLSPFEVKIASHVRGERADRCELGMRQLSVDPEGNVYPCVQFTRGGLSWRVGHVKTGIDEAALARIRASGAREHEPCARCAIRARCNHTCGCLNWQSTGSVHEVSPILCASERILLPIVDRVAELLFRERNSLFLHKHYDPAHAMLSLLEDTLAPDERVRARLPVIE